MTHQTLDKTFIFWAPMFSYNTRPHLSWLIWETMVFTAHLILNDMGFGLGNLRSPNLSSHITPAALPIYSSQNNQLAFE